MNNFLNDKKIYVFGTKSTSSHLPQSCERIYKFYAFANITEFSKRNQE